MHGWTKIAIVSAFTAVLTMFAEPSPALSQSSPRMVEIAGDWLLDKSYAQQYFTFAADLQKRFCGYNWPSTGIARRVQVMNNMPNPPTLSLKKNGTTYTRITTDGDTGPETKLLSNCALITSNRVRCETGSHKFADKGYPDWDAAYFRRDGQYLFIEIPMHKTLMQCPKSKEPPDEVQWTSLRYRRQ
jgi:hypothetical protein